MGEGNFLHICLCYVVSIYSLNLPVSIYIYMYIYIYINVAKERLILIDGINLSLYIIYILYPCACV